MFSACDHTLSKDTTTIMCNYIFIFKHSLQNYKRPVYEISGFFSDCVTLNIFLDFVPPGITYGNTENARHILCNIIVGQCTSQIVLTYLLY